MAADKELFAFELEGNLSSRTDDELRCSRELLKFHCPAQTMIDLHYLLLRFLDGCGSTERLPDWNGPLSELCSTLAARSFVPWSRYRRQRASGKTLSRRCLTRSSRSCFLGFDRKDRRTVPNWTKCRDWSSCYCARWRLLEELYGPCWLTDKESFVDCQLHHRLAV